MIPVTDAGTDIRPPSPSRRRYSAVLLATLTIVTLVILVGGLITFVVASRMRNDMVRGRAILAQGRDALVAGRIDEAVMDFEKAGVRFDLAAERTRSWPAIVTGWVPLMGRTIDVLRSLADAASISAATGAGIAQGIGDLPGGIDGLISPAGAVSMSSLERLERLLAIADRGAGTALRMVRSSPSGLVPGPVSRARKQALEEIQESRILVRSGQALMGAFPSLAGVRDRRRYLFFAEDPAELRGTGGLWGAFALVEARDGRFSVSRFRPVQTLPTLPPRTVPVPFPEYRLNYGEYGAPGRWGNINMTPDFPSAARAALAAWEATGRPPLDGVITADPFALRELLLVTGPVRSPSPAITMTPEDVVPFLTNEAFVRFSDPVERKVVLGEAARVVVERFLTMDTHAMARLRAIVRSVSGGHLKVYASDPSVQAVFARSGVDSGMHAAGGDLAAVIVNAGAGAKIDFFSRRSIFHDVTLLPGGGARATMSVTIRNGAPTSGQPRYVIGPSVGRAGDNIPLVAIFCGRGCRLIAGERDGQPVRLIPGSELGLRFFRDYFRIPSHRARLLKVTTEVPRGWDDSGSDGSYRLTFVGQTTIRPTHAVVRVHAPPGMRFTDGSAGVTLAGRVATWRGVLEDRLELELSLEKEPLLVRLWQTITGTA